MTIAKSLLGTIRKGGGMARTIEEFVAEREIKWLFHFTRINNLGSILQRGLVTRNILVREGSEAVCNDQYRYDGTDAVCVSIEFPNYKMFYSLRQSNLDNEWVVLVIHPCVLWMVRCAFCQTNAASAVVTNIPLPQRMTLSALQLMYTDFGGIQRATLNIPNSYPTNPQAEVLLLDGISPQYIAGVLVPTNAMKERLIAMYPGLTVVFAPRYFKYRTDYEHWKQVV